MNLFGPLLLVSQPATLRPEEMYQVRLGRLELPRPKTHVPETCASTNSATTAWRRLPATQETYTTARQQAPDRVLAASNRSRGWYIPTTNGPSHWDWIPENPCYDYDLTYPVVSGSAF